jgi:cell division protein FtsQ
MKKTGSRRGSGYDAGLGSAVLDAPEERRAPEIETRTPWQGRGPAPAGALQRGYGSDGYGKDGSDGYGGGDYDERVGAAYGVGDEPEYVPRRGSFWQRFRGLPRNVGGRIVLGVVVVGVLGAAAVAVVGVRYYLLHDSRFVVGTSDDIQISGAPHLTRDQVLSVFGADLERNIFRVPLAERRADLERLPWAEHATVMRLLPNRLRVQITERTPVAFVRQGTQIGLVDAGGVLLDMPPDAAGDPHYSFPVLTGLSAADPLSTRAARMEIYERFMGALDGTGEHLTDSVSEVDVSEPEDVKALIMSGSSDILVHFGEQEFLKRYREFEQHLPEWKQAYPQLASADMRYEGQVVLEMKDGAGAAAAGDAGAVAPAVGDAAAITATTTAKAKAKATTKANTEILHSAQNDGEKLTKAKANAHADAVKVKMPVGKKAAAKRPHVMKRAVVAKKKAAGLSAANQREFAALAAAHKAALAKAALGGAAGGKAVKGGGASGFGGATQ